VSNVDVAHVMNAVENVVEKLYVDVLMLNDDENGFVK
jgi:hypothetical protein